MTAGSVDVLVDVGELDEALETAERIAKHLETVGDMWDLADCRIGWTRALSLRGQAAQAAELLDWIETTSREMGSAEMSAYGVGAVAIAHAALGQDEAARALLVEVEQISDIRATAAYFGVLPALLRTSLHLGETALAERLLSGLESNYPLAEHALIATEAALVEARGDLQAAADAYADAADRWERFGIVPEQAFALLGNGRCLLGLARPSEVVPVLEHAREIFYRLKAALALADTDALLQRATALSS